MKGRSPNLLQVGILLLLAGATAAWFFWGPGKRVNTRGHLYVSEPTFDRVSTIDLTTGQIQKSMSVGHLPHQILVDQNGSVYVLESGSQSISAFSTTQQGTPVRQRIIGAAPDILPHRALGPQTMARAASCKTCHPGSVKGSLPGSMAFTRGQKQLWVTELRGHRISQLDAGTLETRQQLGVLGEDSAPTRLLEHPQNGDLYVISRTYTGALPGAAGVGELGLRVALDPEHAGSLGSSSVVVGDAALNTIKGRLELSWAGAGAGIFSQDGRSLFLACRGADRIAVIGLSPLKVLRTIPTAPGPSALAWIGPQKLAVASMNTNPGVVQFFDAETGKLERRVAVGSNPTLLVPDDTHQKLFVACTGNATIAEIDVPSGVVERSFKLEGHPGGLAFVPASI